MSTSLLLLILGAALLYATWNIIIKNGDNKLFETGLLTTGGFLLCLLLLPFLPLPRTESWPYLTISCLCHTVYYIYLASTYEKVDLCLGYTVMRGTAPLLTSLFLLLWGSKLSFSAFGGIAVLCSGILCLACDALRGGSGLRGIQFSLITAVLIACYTMLDGLGALQSGSAAAYACWLFVLKMFPLSAYILLRHKQAYLAYVRQCPLPGLLGGVACVLSYGLAIWAMTRAPIPVVAALRETAVIFGMLLSVCILHEKFTLLRAVAVLLVAAGAAILKLA
ncbi:MAG: EamA family transporter [Desulfovibrio sp.]|nr:EamA family transporter [Desulfovibrio sp.]